MAFSTTGLDQHGVLYTGLSHHGVLYYRPSQHTCDHIMAFSTTGLVNMHVITSWRSLLQA